jgi:multiple sugar transport system substrate-binding protein
MDDKELSEVLRRLSRREVLKWGVYAGVGLSALDLIEACGGSSSSNTTNQAQTPADKTVELVYAAPQEDSGTTVKLVDTWNASNPKTQVKYQQMPRTSADFHTQVVASFTANSPTPDVTDVDVIWPGEFAAAKWILPLDQYASDSLKKSLFDSAIKAGQYKGKLYAIQRWYDSGQLFYRTDLLQKYGVQVPKTMDDLVSASKKIQDGEKGANPNFSGFVWAGAKIEAILDEWLEWVWGMGGDVLDKSGKVKVDTDQGRKALQFMYDTVYTDRISPSGTSTYRPADAISIMQNGNAAFMRNWQFAWNLVQDTKQSKVAGKIGMVALPSNSSSKPGAGCTGGWMLAINSKSKAPDRAWKFVEYMLGQKAQLAMAVGQSVSPVRQDVLNDPQLQGAAGGFFKLIGEVLKSTKGRPQLRNYTDISNSIQPEFNAVISNQKKPADGIKAAQSAIDNIQSA